jgi:hypothetical protein
VWAHSEALPPSEADGVSGSGRERRPSRADIRRMLDGSHGFAAPALTSKRACDLRRPFDRTVGARADPHIQQLTDVVVPVVLDAREYISR